jgi:hypothetical protein
MNNDNTQPTNTTPTATPTKGIYEAVDAISGETVRVIPKQLNATATRLGLTVAELLTTYVGHTGKQALKEQQLTAQETAEKYPNIHPNVMATLGRCFKKVLIRPRKNTAVVVPVTTDAPVTVAEVTPEPENVETVVDSPDEVVYTDDVETVEA